MLSLCALMALWMALHFAPGEPLRRQWAPIGLGLLMFALGRHRLRSVRDASGAAPPSPGLPDLFYLRSIRWSPSASLSGPRVPAAGRLGPLVASRWHRRAAARGGQGAVRRLAAEASCRDPAKPPRACCSRRPMSCSSSCPRSSSCSSRRACVAPASPRLGSQSRSGESCSRSPTCGSCTSSGRGPTGWSASRRRLDGRRRAHRHRRFAGRRRQSSGRESAAGANARRRPSPATPTA